MSGNGVRMNTKTSNLNTKVARGGSWIDKPNRAHYACRSAFRNGTAPDDWGRELGFRVVCESLKSSEEQPRVVRGSSSIHHASTSRCAYRSRFNPIVSDKYQGFRIVCDESIKYSENEIRVVRGGSWIYGTRSARRASRDWLNPNYWYSGQGFRVVVSLDSES